MIDYLYIFIIFLYEKTTKKNGGKKEKRTEEEEEEKKKNRDKSEIQVPGRCIPQKGKLEPSVVQNTRIFK